MQITNDDILNAFKPYNPRPIQISALRKILKALIDKKIPVVEAPAGSGKSVLAYALTNILKTAWIVTPRTTLQRQYQKEFPQFPIGMGQSHYPETVARNKKYEEDPKVRGFDDLTRLADKLYEVMGRPGYGLSEFCLPRPSYDEVVENVRQALDTDPAVERKQIAKIERKIKKLEDKDDADDEIAELKAEIKELRAKVRHKNEKWVYSNTKYARYKSSSAVYLRNLCREDYDPYYKDVYGSTFFSPVSILNHGILAEYVCKRTHMRTHDRNVVDYATGDNIFYKRQVTIIDEAHLLRKMGQWIGDLPINQYQLACLYGNENSPKLIEYYLEYRERSKIIGENDAANELAGKILNYMSDDIDNPGVCSLLKNKIFKLMAVLTDETIVMTEEERKQLQFQLDQLLALQETLDHLHFLKWTTYTVQIIGGELKFKVQDVSPLLDHYIYSTGQFLLFMSATIGESAVFLENIPKEDRHRVEVIRLDDMFNYARSPIICKNVFEKDEPDLDLKYTPISEEVKRILDASPNERGIISCTSFEQAKEITRRVKDKRIICHDGSQKLPVFMQRYIDSDNGVLISPSIKEGLDLKDDLCRFIIIPKLPWDSLSEPADRYYYMKKKKIFENEMVIVLAQMVGRGVRNFDDWAKVYILDAKSRYWLPRLMGNPLLKRLWHRIQFVYN